MKRKKKEKKTKNINSTILTALKIQIIVRPAHAPTWNNTSTSKGRNNHARTYWYFTYIWERDTSETVAPWTGIRSIRVGVGYAYGQEDAPETSSRPHAQRVQCPGVQLIAEFCTFPTPTRAHCDAIDRAHDRRLSCNHSLQPINQYTNIVSIRKSCNAMMLRW